MSEKTAKTLILLLGLVIAAGLVWIGFASGAFSRTALSCSSEQSGEEQAYPIVPQMPIEGQLSVYFMDVGQGDAALLISPSGKTMLIDAGESIYANRVKRFLKELSVSRIDVLVGTHAHSDHIGAMPELIGAFEIGSYVTTFLDAENDFSEAVSEALGKKGVAVQRLRSGSTLDWDESCGVTVLSPVLGSEYSAFDANDSCLMLRVEYGETAFIFTADATVHAEQLSMFHNEKSLFKADVLKVAHHGSTTSSSLGFLETVDADFAVISVGASNPYGHPDPDILNRLLGVGSAVYRTDQCGTVAVFSSGKEISIITQKPER